MAAVAASALAVFKPRSSVSLRMRGSGGGGVGSSGGGFGCYAGGGHGSGGGGGGGGFPSLLLLRCGAIATASLGRGRYISTGIGTLAWFRFSDAVAFSPVRAVSCAHQCASIFSPSLLFFLNFAAQLLLGWSANVRLGRKCSCPLL